MALSGPSLNAPVDLSRLLERGVAAKSDAVASVSREMQWTWRELDQASANLATGLLAHGLKPGDRVASLMPNRGALLVHYLACLRAGLVGVPLNYRYMPPEIDHALKVSGAAAILAHVERAGDLAASLHVGRLSHGIIWYSDDGAEDGVSFESLAAGGSASAWLPAYDAAAAAFIFFTSGSTGPAKGVTHSGESLGWVLAACARAFRFSADDVVLPGSSMSHLGGFMFALSALSQGARVVVARAYDANEILLLLRQERPTVLCMLPAALFGVIRDGHASREDFASLRVCRSGSDKVPMELEREFTALTGFPIDEGYGCTEAGLITLNPPDGVIKIGSVGRPLPGFTLSIRDDAGAEVPVGQDGRLWVRSRTTMLGYWDNPAASAEVIRDSWLDTGDMMTADEDGYLRFRGRKKQIIVHDGSNICPQEVEDALLDHPAVASAGVVGVHDLVHGENVRAFITLKDGVEPPTVDALIRFARERVGYKAPEVIELLDTLPLNPTGKVDRVALKKLTADHLAAHHET